MEYYKLIITNLPAFYKINLFNEINKKKRVFVIFTGEDGVKREKDFLNQAIEFDYINLEDFSKSKKIGKILEILIRLKYNELIIGGWNQIYYWLAIIASPKLKNALIIESSNYESVTNGVKGFIKKIFLSRISKVYASGQSQMDVILDLNFRGIIIKTKGVGLLNRMPQPLFKNNSSVRNFLYVGRLSPEKNLEFLIRIFNKLPNLNLNIIGYGPQEYYLKSIANTNCFFYGSVENKKLHSFYQENDILILPSKSEAWGLVVEEALHNGLPVLLSNRVGCAPEIVDENNGLIFKFDDENDFLSKLNTLLDIKFYNQLKSNISKINFDEIALYQINSYLE